MFSTPFLLNRNIYIQQEHSYTTRTFVFSRNIYVQEVLYSTYICLMWNIATKQKLFFLSRNIYTQLYIYTEYIYTQQE
jgi:hypothetical protein